MSDYWAYTYDMMRAEASLDATLVIDLLDVKRKDLAWRLYLEQKIVDDDSIWPKVLGEISKGFPKPQLREMGWTKARELVKVARKDGIEFACAPWMHKATELPREQFKREVERHLAGKETEAWEILYFKVYKSQLPVVERALETAALMLGSDKSRGYCLEMICADFLAGATLEEGKP